MFQTWSPDLCTVQRKMTPDRCRLVPERGMEMTQVTQGAPLRHWVPGG